MSDRQRIAINRSSTAGFLARTHAVRGAVVAGECAEGIVAGVAFWLRTAVGSEAAYRLLQRAADEAAAPILKRETS